MKFLLLPKLHLFCFKNRQYKTCFIHKHSFEVFLLLFFVRKLFVWNFQCFSSSLTVQKKAIKTSDFFLLFLRKLSLSLFIVEIGQKIARKIEGKQKKITRKRNYRKIEKKKQNKMEFSIAFLLFATVIDFLLFHWMVIFFGILFFFFTIFSIQNFRYFLRLKSLKFKWETFSLWFCNLNFHHD